MKETLSSYDQMLDTVADAIVDPQNAHIRDWLIVFLEDIQQHTIDASQFESSLKKLLSRKDSEACASIIGGVRKRCERYLGSPIQFGEGFPEWAQKKHATVVHVNSQSVIMDFNNHVVRPMIDYDHRWPRRMNHKTFLKHMDTEAIWVATPEQLIKQRREQILDQITFLREWEEERDCEMNALLAEFGALEEVD